jgi:tetratricopeptide (TPR) repeat protein
MEVTMKLARRVLPLMLLVLAFALPSQAQTGEIIGEVIGFDGAPLAGATMVVTRQDIDQEFQVDTGADGTYRTRVPIGRYRVTLQVDGRPLTFVDGINVASNSEEAADFNLPELANTPEARAAMEANARATATAEAFELGRVAMDAGNYDEAIEQFTVATENDDTQHVIFANLAGALSSAGRHLEAAENYQKAIALAPTEAAYYNNMGVAYGTAGEVDRAIEALDQAAQLMPEIGGDAYYNLGVLMTNSGRPADAAAAFERAIEFDPDNADTYYQLALSYFGTADTIPQAIPVLERYLELAPDSPNAEPARQLLAAAQATAGQ